MDEKKIVAELQKYFQGHKFEFIDLVNPDDFSTRRTIKIDGTAKKTFKVSWSDRVEEELKLHNVAVVIKAEEIFIEELKKEIQKYFEEVK